MSFLGMAGNITKSYMAAAERAKDKQTAAEKEQRQLATEIYMKVVDDPSARPEAKAWAWKGLTEVSEGKFKGIDIRKIQPTPADPGQPPELGQMPAPAGQPQPRMRQMPTPPPPTGEQYLTPRSPEEQLRQKTDAVMSVLEEAGVDEETRRQALVKLTAGINPERELQGTWSTIKVTDPNDPTKPKFLLKNNRTREIVDPETNLPWIGAVQPFRAQRTTRVWMRDNASPSGFRMEMRDAVSGRTLSTHTDVLPPAAYLERVTTREAVVEQENGDLVVVPLKSVTGVRTLGSKLPTPPGSAGPAPTPSVGQAAAPTAGGPGRVVGRRVPADIKRQIEFASDLVGHLPRTRELLAAADAEGVLGPFAGRWNQMWKNIGKGNPKYVALSTNLELLKTGLMVPHVGARGGVRLLEHFAGLINAGYMDVATINPALTEIEGFLRSYAEYGHHEWKAEDPIVPPSPGPNYRLQAGRDPKTGHVVRYRWVPRE